MSVASTVDDEARGPSASASVMAMEYGSSPVEAAQHQIDTGPPRLREIGQDRKVMRFAEEGRQVGGQRIDEVFPLWRVGLALQLVQVAGEILPPQARSRLARRL